MAIQISINYETYSTIGLEHELHRPGFIVNPMVTILHEYVGQAPAAAASLKYHRTFSKHTCCLDLALNSTLVDHGALRIFSFVSYTTSSGCLLQTVNNSLLYLLSR